MKKKARPLHGLEGPGVSRAKDRLPICPSVRPRLCSSGWMSQSSKCDEHRRPHNAKSPSLIDHSATRTHAGIPSLAVSHGTHTCKCPDSPPAKKAPRLSAWLPLSKAQVPLALALTHSGGTHLCAFFCSVPLYVFAHTHTHTCTDAAALRAGGGEQLSEEGVEKGRTWRKKERSSMDYRMGFWGVGGGIFSQCRCSRVETGVKA